MTTLLNPSFDSAAHSDDNLLQSALDMHAGWALCRNSPKLLTKCRAVGMKTIYRSTNDGTLDQDAAQLAQNLYNAAPDADYLHIWNEVGLPPIIDAKTRAAADRAHALGKKVIALNVETNYDLSAWKAQKPLIDWLLRGGDGVGLHIYLDNIKAHDDGGLAPLEWLLDTFGGGLICLTEFAPIDSIFNRDRGWRAKFNHNEVTFNQWLDAVYEQYPILQQAIGFLFSITHWREDEQGKLVGFGTEDHPNIQTHIGQVINPKYPVEIKPVTQPIQVPADPGAPVPSTVIESGVRFRAAPSLAAPELRKLALNERVAAYPATRTNVSGYPFEFMETASGEGWASVANLNGDWWIKPDDQPTFRLHPPFMPYLIVSAFNAPRPGYATDYPGKKPLHEGADFEPPAGSTCDPVVHIGADCTVTKVDEQSPVGYGKYIVVDFGNGFTAVYAHFAEVWVKVGQKLANRQIVGLMGATGSASEAHCHITLSNPSIGLDNYVYPKVVNPVDYLA